MDHPALTKAIPIPGTVYNNQDRICHVGYALNQKKLRKSRRIKNESRPSTPSSSSSSSLSLKTTPLPSSLIWQGGGLADIIFGSNQDGSSVIDNVKFSPFDWNSVNTVNTNTKGNNNHHNKATAITAVSSSGTFILSSSSTHSYDNNDEIDDDMSIHYDVIIHKLTEDLEKPYDASSVDKIQRLQTYLKTHPRIIMIDPLESVKKVTSRLRSCENIGQIQPSPYFQQNGINCHLTQPNYFIIHEHDDNLLLQSPPHSTSSSSSPSSESYSNDSKSNATSTAKFLQLMADHNITFPIICKPLLACGSADAHIMSIILHPSDLSLIRTPCIVQQYYNHDSRLFKVYVIGEDVMVFQRPSLPDLNLPTPSQNNNSTMSNEQQLHLSEQQLQPTQQEQNNIQHNNGSSSSNHSSSTCIGEQIECKCYRIDGNTNITATSHQLKSVIFDSRLTYPTLTDFLVDSNGSVDGALSHTNFSTELNRSCGNTNKRCKNDNSENNNGSTNNHVVTNNNIDADATSINQSQLNNHHHHNRNHNHSIIMINNDNNNSNNIDENGCSSSGGDDESLPVPLDCFKHAAKLMSQQFRLSLFGFDVIFSVDDDVDDSCYNNSKSPSSSSSSQSSSKASNQWKQPQELLHPLSRRLIVVDVNYFPSYKEVPDFPCRLRRLLKTASSLSSSLPSSSSVAIVPSSLLLT